MTERLEHSPLPWRLVKTCTEPSILDANGESVAACWDTAGKADANAALIVEAVNAYAKLREAVKDAHDTLCDVWRHEAEFMQPHLAQVVLHTGRALEQVLKEVEK